MFCLLIKNGKYYMPLTQWGKFLQVLRHYVLQNERPFYDFFMTHFPWGGGRVDQEEGMLQRYDTFVNELCILC